MIQYLLRKFCGSYFDFSIEGLSVPLFRLPRFVGWGEHTVTVGQHSMHCYELAKLLYPDNYRVQLLALVHDLPETFYGDIPSYVKVGLGLEAHKLFWEIDQDIYYRLGIPLPRAPEQTLIKELDRTALTLEAWYVFSKDIDFEDWPTPQTWNLRYLIESLKKEPSDFTKLFYELKEKNAKES